MDDVLELTEMQKVAAALKSAALGAEARRRLGQGILDGMLSSISGPVSPVATAKARALADTAASTLTEQLTGTQLRSMGDTLAKAVEAGGRPLDAARQLKEVQALDSVRAGRYLRIQEYLEQSQLSDADVERMLSSEYDRMLQSRRRTIARTEGMNAQSAARRAEGEERGYKFKVWATSQDDKVSDVCAANEAAGVIPIDEPFPSGDMQNPAHPSCRCTVAYLPEYGRAKNNAAIRNKRSRKGQHKKNRLTNSRPLWYNRRRDRK